MTGTPRARVHVLLCLLLTLAGVPGCGSAPEPLAVGVATDTIDDLDAFARTTGATVGLYGWFQAWEDQPAFDADRATAVTARGAVPMVTWEPWSPGDGPDQPRFALARIASGEHDAYVSAFARQVRDWGGPVAVRFLHELNAPHYPWGAGVNGNTPEQAQQAWRHVRALFEEQGADNVVWTWCVDATSAATSEIAPLYPGDEVVDWVAVDGYNWGDSQPWSGWRSPEEVFGPTLEELATLSDRALLITETGSAEGGGDKAAWIRDLFRTAEAHGVRGVVWFDHEKEADWRVASSSASMQAFRTEVAAEGRTAPPPVPRHVLAGPDG